ncbi:developmentally-regulated protein [Acrasis kona]|uniref:Developmentally-regulated protein n=1 Tax=Acrasis kona TaxID=1008807 RepID=A0AAW2ZFX1_9EUKA
MFFKIMWSSIPFVSLFQNEATTDFEEQEVPINFDGFDLGSHIIPQALCPTIQTILKNFKDAQHSKMREQSEEELSNEKLELEEERKELMLRIKSISNKQEEERQQQKQLLLEQIEQVRALTKTVSQLQITKNEMDQKFKSTEEELKNARTQLQDAEVTVAGVLDTIKNLTKEKQEYHDTLVTTQEDFESVLQENEELATRVGNYEMEISILNKQLEYSRVKALQHSVGSSITGSPTNSLSSMTTRSVVSSLQNSPQSNCSSPASSVRGPCGSTNGSPVLLNGSPLQDLTNNGKFKRFVPKRLSLPAFDDDRRQVPNRKIIM